MRHVAFDFETFLIAPGVPAPQPVCMSFAEAGQDVGLVTAADCWPLLLGWLESPDVVLIGANTAFDLGVAMVWCPDPQRMLRGIFTALDQKRVRDVQVRDKLLMLAEGRLTYDYVLGNVPSFSLSALSERYLKMKMEKGQDTYRLRYAELLGVPIHDYPGEAIEYAALDAMATLEVYLAQRDLNPRWGAASDMFVNEAEQTDASWSLHLASMAGLEVDLVEVEQLRATLEAQAEAVRSQLRAVGIMRADGSKDQKKLRARIVEAYATLGTSPPMTEKGAVSTASDTLEASGDELLQEMSGTGSAEKLLSTFLPMLSAGIVNPRYDVLKETGRTSSFQPNIQQMPRKGGIRELYLPPAGQVFLDADYSTVELVALAQVCLDLFGHSAMATAINAGQDLHIMTAARIMGLEYADCLARYKAGDKAAADTRQISKALNFGLPGGMGPEAFVEFARGYGLALDVQFVGSLKREWLDTYPEMHDYFAHVSALAGASESFELTQLRSGRVRGGCRYTAGCNSLFQGLAADGAKRAMGQLVRECLLPSLRSPLQGCLLLAFVHDEFLLSAPVDRVHEAAARLEEVMVEGMRYYTPHVAVRVDVVASERWSKSAQRVVVDGRLQVWRAP